MRKGVFKSLSKPAQSLLTKSNSILRRFNISFTSDSQDYSDEGYSSSNPNFINIFSFKSTIQLAGNMKEIEFRCSLVESSSHLAEEDLLPVV
ncbi:hypothetical protein Ddc_06799 [Ditylenchus destructor]|nr:hypothetical protein Ddc_06799 [Ditylenchus destructor]